MLSGVTEAAALFGVSKQRVNALRARSDFPPPLAQLAAGPVWRTEDLESFLNSWDRRPGRRAK